MYIFFSRVRDVLEVTRRKWKMRRVGSLPHFISFTSLFRLLAHGKIRPMVAETRHHSVPRNPHILENGATLLKMRPAGRAGTQRPRSPVTLPCCLHFFPAVPGGKRSPGRTRLSKPLPNCARGMSYFRGPTGTMPAQGLGDSQRERVQKSRAGIPHSIAVSRSTADAENETRDNDDDDDDGP